MAQKPSLLAAQAMLRAHSEDAPLPGRHDSPDKPSAPIRYSAPIAPPKGSPRAKLEEIQEGAGEYRGSPLGKPMMKDLKDPPVFKPSILDMKGFKSSVTRGAVPDLDEDAFDESMAPDPPRVNGRGAPEVYQRAAPRPGVAPRPGLREPILGGRARVNAPKGSRTAIVLEIGGESLATELSILEEEGCDPEEYVHTKCDTLSEEVRAVPGSRSVVHSPVDSTGTLQCRVLPTRRGEYTTVVLPRPPQLLGPPCLSRPIPFSSHTSAVQTLVAPKPQVPSPLWPLGLNGPSPLSCRVPCSAVFVSAWRSMPLIPGGLPCEVSSDGWYSLAGSRVRLAYG